MRGGAATDTAQSYPCGDASVNRRRARCSRLLSADLRGVARVEREHRRVLDPSVAAVVERDAAPRALSSRDAHDFADDRRRAALAAESRIVAQRCASDESRRRCRPDTRSDSPNPPSATTPAITASVATSRPPTALPSRRAIRRDAPRDDTTARAATSNNHDAGTGGT